MSLFKTVHVEDPEISGITDDLVFQVRTGASSNTYQPFVSNSSGNSAVSYNILAPNENVVISRQVLHQVPMSFQIKITGVPENSLAFQYGLTDSISAFPFSSIVSTGSLNINNCASSETTSETLYPMLRLNDTRELLRYNSTCPSMPDTLWAQYADAVKSTSNPLASMNNSAYDIDQLPRGSFPSYVNLQHFDSTGYLDVSPVSRNLAGEYWIATIMLISTEPVMMSPFIWNDENKFMGQGLVGVNNINFTFNIDSTLKRIFGTANAYTYVLTQGLTYTDSSPAVLWSANANMFQVPSVAGSPLKALSQPTMLFNFKSTQPTSVIKALNVVPYSNKMRYIVSQQPTNINSLATIDMNSSNIQLSQLPDCFIIYARKQWANQTIQDANYFLQINSISLNLSNSSGLLAGASAYDLWRLARKNGSNQSWVEFSGQGLVNVFPYSVSGDASTIFVATSGSMLVISPEDLSLPYYCSAGSITNANLQFRVNITNQLGDAVDAELVVICVNSGVMSINSGTAQIFQGILTKAMVEETVHQPENAMTTLESERLVGGKMRKPIHPHHMRHMRHHMGHSSGGAMSGGAHMQHGHMAHQPRGRKQDGMY